MATTTSEFTTLLATAQQQALTSLEQAQELWLRTAKTAVGLIPGNGGVPSPRDVVEASFGFAGQVLELQKQYALQMADVVAEGAGKLAKSTAKAAKN